MGGGERERKIDLGMTGGGATNGTQAKRHVSCLDAAGALDVYGASANVAGNTGVIAVAAEGGGMKRQRRRQVRRRWVWWFSVRLLRLLRRRRLRLRRW